MLNFRCANCQQEIQADYQFIGELVQCPLCETVQAVPDPLLPSGSFYHGYQVERVRANSLLWTTYQGLGQSAHTGQTVVIRVPTRFFLKRVTDFGAFVETVIKGGSLNMPEFPRLLDRSVVSGKVYFVFEYLRDAHNLPRFTRPGDLLEPQLTLLVARNIATALRTAWDKEGMVHQNLIPHNLRLREDWNVRITNMGLSPFLLADQSLLQHGFNIWDYRYMSPEFLEAGVAGTPSVDIYALGGILHLLNTGHDPYEDVAPGEIAAAPLPEVRTHAPEVPEELGRLVQRLMARDPAVRPSSWDEVIGLIDKTMHVGVGPARLSVTDVIRKSVTAGAQTGAFDPVGLPAGDFLPTKRRSRKKAAGDTEPRQAPQKPTETVAKLAPMNLPLNTLNRRWRRPAAPPRREAAATVVREEEAKRVILGAMALVVLVVLGAVAAFVFFRPAARPRPVVKPAVAEVAPADVSAVPTAAVVAEVPRAVAAPVAPSPDKAPMPSPLSARIAAIEAFAAENPAAFAEILRRYDEVLREAIRLGRSDAVDAVHERIAAVERSRDMRVQSVLDALEARATALLEAGDSAGAIRLLREYDDDYAEETRPGRIRLALKHEQSQGEANEQALAALGRLAALFTAQVPALLSGEVMEAEVQLKLNAALPENQGARVRYEDLARQLAEYRSLKPKLVDAAGGGAVIAGISADDALLLGLAHFDCGDVALAREAFSRLPGPLARPLAEEIARREAQLVFQRLLKEAGLAFDPGQPEQLLLELTRKRVPTADASKLAAGLKEFGLAHGESAFAKANANLISEVAQYCERIVGTKLEVVARPVVIVDPATGEGLRRAIEKAPSGTEISLPPGTYQLPRLEVAVNDVLLAGGPGVIFEGTLLVLAHGVEIRGLSMAKGQLLVEPSARRTVLRQCRFEDQETRLNSTEVLLAENCLFRGLYLKNGQKLVFRHCTFLAPRRGVEVAVRMETAGGAIEIVDSIIHGGTYGILFSSEAGARDRLIHNCLWHAASGLAALQETEVAPIATRTVVDRATRLRRYCRTKNNLHVRPQFVNAIAGDWRLVPGVPGSGKASDGQDMGVVWP
jgi:hypothetical protein